MMIDKFNDFENIYKLFDLKIDDFCLWIYIRFELYFAIGEFFGITNGKGSTPKTSIKDRVCMFYNSFIANPMLFTKKSDILIIPHQRRILEGSTYKCIYTDVIAEEFDGKALTAEFLFGKIHYKPAASKNIVYLDYIDVIPGIVYKLSKRKQKEISMVSKKIESAVEEYFDIKFEEGYLESLISKRFYYYKYKKRLLKKFVKKVSPKVILELVGYETNKMVLNEVANELNIPCIELQHGVIGRGHIAYNYKSDNSYKQLPTHLFVYSDYWKKTCSFPIGFDNIIATGFPYMEEQISKYPYIENISDSVRIIIYSSTDSTDSILEFAIKLITKLDQNMIKYKIIYKLHPLEYNYPISKWDAVRNLDNIEFINTPTKSLYELCSNSDIQIGVKTTAVFEGLSYGLETFILDTGAPDIDYYMGDLVRLGYAVYGKTADDFISLIKRKSISNIGERDNPLFVKNSKQRIIEEIGRIIEL